MFFKKNYKRVAYYIVGYLGEIVVIWLLKCKLYHIIKHRYKCVLGEIDIIASKNKHIVFIEVKSSIFGSEIPITYKQQRSIIRVAKYFITHHADLKQHDIRFDLYFLSLSKGIIHIPNAWQEP
ncbi:MAG: YraN family protein [Ehrlichia sp.]